MNSEQKRLIFNGRLELVTFTQIDGPWPNREWFISSSSFTDNLDGRGISDALPGDIIIDSSKNRFEFSNFTGATGAGLFNIKEAPWSDQLAEFTGTVAPYSQPQAGTTFMFRKTPNCELFQHGREALGIQEDIVEVLSQKANYQIEEELCGPSGTFIPRNILGSSGALAPVLGQTGGIPGDRDIPVEGDEWVNPDTGDRYIYNGTVWEQTPDFATAPTGAQGANGATGAQGTLGVDGQTGAQGSQGFQGHTGAQGSQGFQGHTGAQGMAGSAAMMGDTGAQGHQGFLGPTGAQGFQGVPGSAAMMGDTGAQGHQGFQGPTGAQGFQGVMGSAAMMGDTGAQGHQGFQGHTGAQGSQGFQGHTGAQGNQGFQGFTGAQGSQGFQGHTGAQGSQGFQGHTGAQGSQGFQGHTGAQGSQGFQGHTGAQGSQGFQGHTGAQGSQGFQGFTGAQGSQGFQGHTGAQGSQGFQGHTGAQGSQGFQGHTGAQGSQGFQGHTGAQGSQGFQGHTGAQGSQGFQGFQGHTGAQGSQGFQGFTGAQGSQGFQGFTGAQGSQGFQGHTGAQGSQGFQGHTGAQGAQGFQGHTGAQGSQGFQGHTGAQGFQGVMGSAAMMGDTGAQGNQGFQGPTGAQGFQGVMGSAAMMGDTGAQGHQGFQGSTGAQGNQGFQGSTGAQGAQGFQGHTGAQGSQGFQGSTGAQGNQGFQGSTGAGVQGADGAAGSALKAMTFDSFEGSDPTGGEFVTFMTDVTGTATVRRVLNNQIAWPAYYEPTTTSFPTAFREGIDTDSRRNVYTSVHLDSSNRIDLLKFTDAAENLWESSSYPAVSGYSVNSTEYKTEVALDHQENLFVAGVFDATISFVNQGTSATGAPDLTAGGGDDIFLGKLNDAGEWQWSFRIGGVAGTADEGEPSLDADCCGNAFLAGQFASSELEFFDSSGSTGINLTKISTGTNTDIFLLKVNAHGKVLWTLNAGTSTGNVDQPAVGVDGNKNTYLAFRVDNVVTGDVTIEGAGGSTSITISKQGTSNVDNIMLVKFDRNGIPLWGTIVSGTDGSGGVFGSLDMAVDDCGCVYLTANYTLDTVEFGDLNTIFNSDFNLTQTSSNDANAFLVKYNSDGKPIWVVKSAPSTTDGDGLICVRVSVDDCGNVHWVGVSDNNADVNFFDFGEGNGGTANSALTIDFVGPNTIDGYFGFKVDETGDGVYSFKIGTSGSLTVDGANVAVNNCGDIFLIGRAIEVTSFIPADLQFFNPGQAGSGGTRFSRFDKTFAAGENARILVKLANEVRSASLIGNIQEVTTTTSVKVAFNGQITIPSTTLSLNKNYYLDTDAGTLTTFSANNGCENRLIGVACGTDEIFFIGDQVLCKDPLCINPDFTSESRPVRYIVATFTNASADNGNIVARSFVKEGITATRTGPSTIINVTGYVYNISISAGDDIQHLSIFDKHGGSGAASFRVIFTWSDADFVGNIAVTEIIPVAPTVTVSAYVDSGGDPSVGSSSGVHRVSGTSSNEFRTYGFSGKSITVDVQLQDGMTTWYCANFTF